MKVSFVKYAPISSAVELLDITRVISGYSWISCNLLLYANNEPVNQDLSQLPKTRNFRFHAYKIGHLYPSLLHNLLFHLNCLRQLYMERPSFVFVEPSYFSFLLPITFIPRPRKFILFNVEPPITADRLRSRLWSARNTLISYFYDYITLASEKFLQFYKFPNSKVIICPNGVDSDSFCPSVRANSKIVPFLKDFKYNLVYSGSFGKLREIPKLLVAFERANKLLRDISLTLIGEVPVTVKQKISELQIEDLVFIIPRVDHLTLARYLPCFDVGLSWIPTQPCYYFTLPFKTMEYMASGLPVVATRTYGNSTLVKDGYNGFLCSDNSEDFAKGIIKILQRDEIRKRMAHNARNSVLHLDVKRIIEYYLIPLIRSRKVGVNG